MGRLAPLRHAVPVGHAFLVVMSLATRNEKVARKKGIPSPALSR